MVQHLVTAVATVHLANISTVERQNAWLIIQQVGAALAKPQ
jgi:hypothetical protein